MDSTIDSRRVDVVSPLAPPAARSRLRSAACLAGATVAAVVLMGLVAPRADALPYERLGSLFDQVVESDGGEATVHQQRVAVNHSTGRAYLADVVGDRVRVFDATESGATEGTAFGSGEVTDPLGIAVDQDTGAVYVSDADDVVKYTSAGVLDPSFDSPGLTGPIAFDQASDLLVVADVAGGVVRHYTPIGLPSGTPFDGADSGTAFAGLQDVAVNSTGDVLVVDSDGNPSDGTGTSRVERFSATGGHEATFGPVAGAARVAVAPGTDQVIVSGNQDAVNRDENPTLSVFDDDTPAAPVEVIPTDASMKWTTVQGLAIDDGPDARLYVVGDVGIYLGSSAYGNITVQVYERAQPAAPAVLATSAEPVYTRASLKARIDPGYSETTWSFEYGTTTAYGTSTPSKTIPAIGDPVDVSVVGEGLTPGTVYHYRVVATNGVDTTTGPDQTFTTKTPAGADACSNSAYRAGRAAAVLPDCRAWEKVSPDEKNGGDAGGTLLNDSAVQSSANGDAVAYFSDDAFADSESSQFANTYVGSRGADTWSTRAILPRMVQDNQITNHSRLSNFISADLSKAVILSATPLTAGASPGVRNLYMRDNASGTYELITAGTPSNAIPGMDGRSHTTMSVTPDFGRVLFQSPLAWTPDAPGGASSNLYEWVAGTPGAFRLVGVLPDGSIDPAGASAGSADAIGDSGSFENAISDDGSRAFFSSPPGSPNIYVREDGETTQISADGIFWTATADGSRALLTVGSGSSARLERYDVGSGIATDLAPDAEPADGVDPGVFGVVGNSDDLSSVYFMATGRLVPGQGQTGGNNLYLSRDGEVTFIGTLDNTDSEYALWMANGYPSTGDRSVTPDGDRLAFVSKAQLTDYENATPSTVCPDGFGNPGPCPEVYLYDSSTGDISCATCVGAPGKSRLLPSEATQTFAKLRARRNNLSSDGSRLFFQSTKPLAPEDTNGATDVYVWEDGEARLISGGVAGRDGALFMGASPSGDDVFFTTRTQLVPSDTDDSRDLYDARVDGGLSGQHAVTEAPPSCSGEGCLGQPTPAPVLPAAGTVTFEGAGGSADRAAVGKARVSRRGPIVGSAGTLRIRVPGEGRLKLSGAGLRPRSRSVSKAGTYKVRVTLTKSAVAKLRKQRRLTATVRVAFTPAGGSGSVTRVRLTFDKPKSGGRGR